MKDVLISIRQGNWRSEMLSASIDDFKKLFKSLLDKPTKGGSQIYSEEQSRHSRRKAVFNPKAKELLMRTENSDGDISWIISQQRKPLQYFQRLHRQDWFLLKTSEKLYLLTDFGRGRCRTAFDKLEKVFKNFSREK